MLASLRFRISAACVLLVAAALLIYEIAQSLVVTLAVSVVAAALFGLAMSSTVLRPLGRMARAARAMASGDLAQRVDAPPSGEVGQLAEVFNEMAQSLQRLMAAASEERNRLTAALNSSTDAVLAVNAEGRIAFVNLAAERLFFRSQDELVGNPFAWVMPNEQVLDALKASREDGQRGAIVVERPNRQYLQVITTPIIGGGDWAALVVFHDLTDVKRVEQVRRDFVANVSHELRTPLASVKSVLETLQGGAIEDRRAAEDFISRANAEVDRLAQMVEELLELSRIESGEVPLAQQPVDMGKILAEAVERVRPQADRQGLNLTCEVGSGLPPIIGDAARLERAVLNLLHNAIKFTSSGGSVEASAAFDGAAVTVKVHDTGAGIAPDDLPRVFERFFKADRSRGERGTGLGLAVVKHTVEAHGGTVSVESEPGQGSTFSFSILAPSMPLSTEPTEEISD